MEIFKIVIVSQQSENILYLRTQEEVDFMKWCFKNFIPLNEYRKKAPAKIVLNENCGGEIGRNYKLILS